MPFTKQRSKPPINKQIIFVVFTIIITILILLIINLFKSKFVESPAEVEKQKSNIPTKVTWKLGVVEVNKLSSFSYYIVFSVSPFEMLNPQDNLIEVEFDKDSLVNYSLRQLAYGNNFKFLARYNQHGSKTIKIRLKEANEILADRSISLNIESEISKEYNEVNESNIETENIVKSCKPGTKNNLGIVIQLVEKFKKVKVIYYQEHQNSGEQEIKKIGDRFVIKNIRYKPGKQIYLNILDTQFIYALP